MAGLYLFERGHREIGVIPGPLERNTGAGRLAGFMKAMEEAMIKVPESWIVQGDFEPESGYRAMQQILSQSHRPTAVFWVKQKLTSPMRSLITHSKAATWPGVI